MSKQSQWIGSPAWERGQKVEREFERLLVKRDPNYRRATEQEQYKHIDFRTYFGTIDVKAKKRLSRASRIQEEKLWLEFKNVQGKHGWLTAPHLDVVAFERDESFVLVKRVELLELADNLCDLSHMVESTDHAMYRGYSRKGRKDLLSVIKMSDLQFINYKVWRK